MTRHAGARRRGGAGVVSLIVVVVAVLSAAAIAAEGVDAAVFDDAHLLPRPLVIELPTTTSSSSPALAEEGEGEAVPAE